MSLLYKINFLGCKWYSNILLGSKISLLFYYFDVCTLLLAEVLRTKHSKKLPKLAMDKELKPVQRNVWDRLGKPQNESKNPFLRERNNSLPVPTATVPPMDPVKTQNLPSALPFLPHTQHHFVSTSLYPEEVVKTSSICTPMRVNGVIVNKLKRQFEQIESHLLASAVTSKSRERVPAKQRLGISVRAPQLLPVGNCFSSNMAKEPALVQTGLKPEIVSNAESVNSEQRSLIVRNISIFLISFICNFVHF